MTRRLFGFGTPTSSTTILPCFEIDSTTARYPNAISQTFYDGAGRTVETSTPTPTPSGQTGSYYTIVLTEYSDSTHSVWKSTPFVVSGPASGAGWLDPHGAKDYTGSSVFGTATYYDALNRPIAVQDPMFNSPSVPGISCASLGSAATPSSSSDDQSQYISKHAVNNLRSCGDNCYNNDNYRQQSHSLQRPIQSNHYTSSLGKGFALRCSLVDHPVNIDDRSLPSWSQHLHLLFSRCSCST